jgi:phage terminase large subunit GpA-like protein
MLQKISVEIKPQWPMPMLTAEASNIRFRFSEAERNIYRKDKKIPVSNWAEQNRVVTRGPLEGTRYNRETTPYLAGIMDASFFPSVETVIVCSGPQVGKSFCVDTCIGYAVDLEPGPVLYVYPDEDTALENSKDRILPMIQKSAKLRRYLTGSEDDEAAKRINLQHMQIYMAWARSAIKLANKSIRYLVFDETDKYPETSGRREADPISLGEARTTTYRWGSKTWKLSTPTVEGGQIWQALTTEAQVIFEYAVRCPFCKKYQMMEFTQFKWPEKERDPEKVENDNLAHYECRHCKAAWNDRMRDRAVRLGHWRSSGREWVKGPDAKEWDAGRKLSAYLKEYRPKKIGFHIPSWLSRFVPLSRVAAAFLSGLQDKTKLKDFRNKHTAEPWLDYTEERKESKILQLRDDRARGFVPGGGVVSCLTAGVDTQDNGFWYEIRAWGFGMAMESWQVREGFTDSFEALGQILVTDRYEDVDGKEYPVRLSVHDAMGHRTADVYDFVRMHPGAIVAFKGEERMTQPWSWSNIDVYPGTKKAIPGGVKLLRADVNYHKNILAAKLAIAAADPGAWHLHAETSEEWARHLCAEYINDKGLWECPAAKANHGWDCSVYALVAANVLGVKHWQKAAAGRGRREVGKVTDKKTAWIKTEKENWFPK